VKLLRVLQEREITPVGGTATSKINVRILAATNVNLEEAVGKGRFREDLDYRLNVLRIHTPALSEREDDAVVLANHFLERKAHGKKIFSPEALGQIMAYSWPGNVRQLENAVERAIAFNQGGVIASLELDLGLSQDRESQVAENGAGPGAALEGAGTLQGEVAPTLVDIEKAYIFWILSQNGWHKATAAKILGLEISTLYRKIERDGLKAPA
jgi:DNA-binding NtrC family response regulator